MASHDTLNSSQALHLLSSCRYVDQLLSEVESIVTISASKSAFPKYRSDLCPAEIKVIHDYLARIRTQMLRGLRSLGMTPPPPRLEARRSIRVNLEFACIAFDECRAEAMRGYGEVPASLIPDLNGLVEEMKGVLQQLSAYLAYHHNLEARLRRLEHTSPETGLLQTLKRVIDDQGLTEFRPALEIILERLESSTFEIAVFGRVSSGKSSLLNHLLEAPVLPVGVTPITAVPTRIMQGTAARFTVTYVDQKAERLELARLPEFVSEEFNPGNAKHVARIVVELPARRLQDGVVLVDTPGLGSLATAGAETLAYLPSCDLGLVLIAAGSTLNQEDLAILQGLYEAAIPAFVLLSKADLLGSEDCRRVVDYTAAQIASQLGLQLPVHPVSTVGEHARLLDEWFAREIQPLCARHQELARQSLRRKVGALLEGVEAALQVRMELSGKRLSQDGRKMRAAERQLRRATGRFEEANALCLKRVDDLGRLGRAAIAAAASAVVESWFGKSQPEDTRHIVRRHLAAAAADGARDIFQALCELAQVLSQAIASAAIALETSTAAAQEDWVAIVKEMPRFDPPALEILLKPGPFKLLGRRLAKWRVQTKLLEQIGRPVDEAFQSYARMLEAWSRRVLAELRRQFDAHADGYRAQLERLGGTRAFDEAGSAGVRQALEMVSRLRKADLPAP